MICAVGEVLGVVWRVWQGVVGAVMVIVFPVGPVCWIVWGWLLGLLTVAIFMVIVYLSLSLSLPTGARPSTKQSGININPNHSSS